VLLRLTYLAVTNGLAMLRLLPMSDRAKDAEILAPATPARRSWNDSYTVRVAGPVRPS
jgi:hypothetical protein